MEKYIFRAKFHCLHTKFYVSSKTLYFSDFCNQNNGIFELGMLFFVRQMYDLKLKIACGGTILTKKSQIKKKIHFIYITFNFLILYYCSIDIKRES